MRIGIGQILVLLIASFLLFGDFENIKKKVIDIIKPITNFLNGNKKKTRKKGI